MAKKAKSRRPGLLRTLLAVLVVLALAATLLFTVFRRQVDTMEYPCRYKRVCGILRRQVQYRPADLILLHPYREQL